MLFQTLEAEQKQHSILIKHEESQQRLHEIAAERRRRLEEKLGREEAAKVRLVDAPKYFSAIIFIKDIQILHSWTNFFLIH